MGKDAISKAALGYRLYSVWLIAALTLAALVALAVSPLVEIRLTGLANSLAISVIYAIVVSVAYASAWEKVARTSAPSLTQFYLVGSVLKMLAALAVFLVAAFVMGKPDAITFAFVFATYYVALLVFDCIYFARTEKKDIFNENKTE